MTVRRRARAAAGATLALALLTTGCGGSDGGDDGDQITLTLGLYGTFTEATGPLGDPVGQVRMRMIGTGRAAGPAKPLRPRN